MYIIVSGADTVEKAIEMHRQLQELFSKAEFLLRKWNSSSPAVLESILAKLHPIFLLDRFSSYSVDTHYWLGDAICQKSQEKPF